ncbi:unnamed protein product, partial [Symbiodinium pilosum]
PRPQPATETPKSSPLKRKPSAANLRTPSAPQPSDKGAAKIPAPKPTPAPSSAPPAAEALSPVARLWQKLLCLDVEKRKQAINSLPAEAKEKLKHHLQAQKEARQKEEASTSSEGGDGSSSSSSSSSSSESEDAGDTAPGGVPARHSARSKPMRVYTAEQEADWVLHIS